MRPPILRRKFVQTCALGLVIEGTIGWQALQGKTLPLPAGVIRPPGALPETQFNAACIRCGLCVQACPFDTLRLAATDMPPAPGTPYFHARDIPCAMCVDIPCLKACPTGALSPKITDINDARMGVAVLSHPGQCNSYIGSSYCNACYRACPLKGTAITLKQGRTPMNGMFTPTVDANVCTGCGQCEKACIAPDAAITVVTRHA